MFGLSAADLGDVVDRRTVTAAPAAEASADGAEAEAMDADADHAAREGDAEADAEPPAKRRRTEKSSSRKRGRALSSHPAHPTAAAVSSPPFRSATALHILQTARARAAAATQQQHGNSTSPALRSRTGSPALRHSAAAAASAAASSAHFALPASALHSSPAAASPAGRGNSAGNKAPFRAPAAPRSKLEQERQSLPVFAHRDEILRTVRDNDTTILVGETGSGKTTQIPQYLLSDGGVVGRGQVGCTQPRRVAAVSVATRVASEYGCSLGAQVGYTIRFDDTSGPLTRLKYLTDGMMLREIIADPWLSKYNALVLDEAHERTVVRRSLTSLSGNPRSATATDILFALLKQIQRRRKRVLAARKERNEALHRGKGLLSPKQQAAAAAASAAKSPKLAAAIAAAAATKSPRPSPVAAAVSAAAATRSPSSAAASSSSATAATADAAAVGDPSPGMHPLCLLSDETHPQPRPTSKEARKERKKRKREEAEKREAAIAAAAAAAAAAAPAVSPAAAPATAAVAAASSVIPSFALDDENAPIDLAQVPNLDNLQELKLVVMSATLAAKDFSSYFGSAPVLSIAGRTHPVELLYAEEAQVDYLDAVLVAVLQIHVDAGDRPGDILVFLTGAEEIEAARRSIEEKARKLRPQQQQQQQQQEGEDAGSLLDLHVCAIYASLPPEVQLQVFAPARPGARKVILATNIAETSLTIPGVRFVVDSGVTKMRLYDANRGSDMLRVVEISQAEATQRAGRAGRDAPGEAYRLYREEDFKKLKPHLLPEILRSNLASVVLQLKALRVRNVLNFDFMTRPSRAALTRALEELYALRALGYNGDLSPLGSQMVHFPLPPHYAKIAIMSSGPDLACSVEALKILAMMSVENVFFVPSKSAAESAGATMNNNSAGSSTTGAELSSGKQSALAAYAQAKRQFAHVDGDHFTYLDVFNAFVLVQFGGAGGATTTNAATASNCATSAVRRTQEWCRTHFLNYRNLLKAQQVYAQLVALMERLDLPLVSANAAATGRETDPVAHTDPIKKALLLGLYSRVARKQAHDASYVTLSDGQTVYIHPSSVLLVRSTKARPELVVYTELVHTSRAYMRDCMELPDLRWLAESNNNNSSTDETSAVGASTTSVVRGGKQQAELHARLAGINTSGSKLSGSGVVASSSATATSGPALTLAQQAAAVGLTKKQLKRQLKAAAAPPERAAPHASAMQIDEQQRPPREKKKKPKDGRGSALLDFVNSL